MTEILWQNTRDERHLQLLTHYDALDSTSFRIVYIVFVSKLAEINFPYDLMNFLKRK